MPKEVPSLIASDKGDPLVRLQIGGWLSLIAAGLVVGPLLGVGSLFADYAMLSMVPKTEYPGLDTLIVADVAILSGLIAFQVVVAVLFFRRHPLVPRLMIAWLATNLAAAVLLFFWAKEVFNEWPEFGSSLGRPIAMAVIWIPYFLLSRRVKLTFACPRSVPNASMNPVDFVRSSPTSEAKESTAEVDREIYLLTDHDTVEESHPKRRDPLDDLVTDDDLLSKARTPKLHSRVPSNHAVKHQPQRGRGSSLVITGLFTLALGLLLGIVTGQLGRGKTGDPQTPMITSKSTDQQRKEFLAQYDYVPTSEASAKSPVANKSTSITQPTVEGERPSIIPEARQHSGIQHFDKSDASPELRIADQVLKESNLSMRVDRAKRTAAFTLYEQGIEAARKADQQDVANEDELWASAIQRLIKAAEIDPSFTAPLSALACIERYYKGRHGKAKDLLNEVILREPTNAEAHYYLADVCFDNEDDAEALREANRAVILDPDFAPAYKLRSHLYKARNDQNRANARAYAP